MPMQIIGGRGHIFKIKVKPGGVLRGVELMSVCRGGGQGLE